MTEMAERPASLRSDSEDIGFQTVVLSPPASPEPPIIVHPYIEADEQLVSRNGTPFRDGGGLWVYAQGSPPSHRVRSPGASSISTLPYGLQNQPEDIRRSDSRKHPLEDPPYRRPRGLGIGDLGGDGPAVEDEAWSACARAVKEFDDKLIESWRTDMDTTLVFVSFAVLSKCLGIGADRTVL